jgi:hypothetical protein
MHTINDTNSDFRIYNWWDTEHPLGRGIEERTGQLSDCNSLSGSNSLTNRMLNKKLII